MEGLRLSGPVDSINTPCPPFVPFVGTDWKDDVRRIAAAHDVPEESIYGPSQKRKVARARFEVFHRLRQRGRSTPWIGARIGWRDHTTVIHGLRRFAQLVALGEIRPVEFNG